ncbi:MAG: hypothetical protein M2R46_03487 [Verrucomicrobia subdivision 3 bacterium]|nr:hypothetical protein [Limisphaerales bacterium]
MPCKTGAASPDLEARMRRCKRRAAGCVSPRSRANWWLDKLFLALIGVPIAMNHFWSGTLVFLKRVPAKTLKPDLQTWQGQRPIRRLSAFLATLPLAQWGQRGFITPAHPLPMRKAGFLIRKALEYGQQIHKRALIRAPEVKHRPLPAMLLTYHCADFLRRH